MIPGSANPLLLAAAEAGAYQISRSVRLNSADSAYFSRTPASAGNRKTWTWAGWVKRGKLGTVQRIFSAGSSGTAASVIEFTASDTLQVWNYPGSYTTQKITNAVFRDTAAWYHIVISQNSSTSFNLYVNNVAQTFSTSTGPDTSDWYFNSTAIHTIGTTSYSTTTSPGDFYLADVHFIDGQALDPTSFTEVDATTGQLVPIEYTGSYGTNGFHLPFSDNSTAAALGTDTSGAGNDWDVYNISVLQGNGSYVGSTSGSFYSPFNDPYKVFDGVLASPNMLYVYSNMTGRLTFSAPLSGVIEIYASNGGSVTDPAGEDIVAISDGSTIDVSAVTYTNRTWFSFGSKTNISWIELRHNDTTGQGPALFAIRVNGVVLIDNTFSSGNDSLVDTPTNYGTDTGAGGEVRGNYATWNPLSKDGGTTLTNGNLDISSANYGNNTATFFLTSGKWYWEGSGSGYVAAISGRAGQNWGTSISATGSNSIGWWELGPVYWDGGNNGGSTGYSSSDIIGTALDMDSGIVYFYKNGSLIYTITFGSGTVPDLSDGVFPCYNNGVNITKTVYYNFGQRPFAHTAPSGFKALCTTNLDDPLVAKPSEVMDVALWTGNGGNQSITLPGGFNPDLVWVKSRSNAQDHYLFDAVRGGASILRSNTTGAESTGTTYLSFDTSGFSSLNGLSSSGYTYAGWVWDAGSSTVSNTDGSITSTVRANPTAGFSIATVAQPSSGSFSIGHGLGVAPAFFIYKRRSDTSGWGVWHQSLSGGTYYLVLNGTAAQTNDSTVFSALPTSTVVNMGSAWTATGAQTGVLYSFAPVDGYSSFGSYTGNGSADGPFVYTGGFKPRWLMIKRTDSTGSWIIWDTSRTPYNLAENALEANSSNAESSGWQIDLLSNGFKSRNVGTQYNASGGTYVWAAFAENPFKTARAR